MPARFRPIGAWLVWGALLPGVFACKTSMDVRHRAGCETYLIAPPQHPSLAASDAISQAWADHVLPHMEACDKVIKPDASKELFHFVNVNNTLPLDMRHPNAAQLNTLRDKSKATHVVFLNYRVSHRMLTLRATVYRLRPHWQMASKKQLPDEAVALIQQRLEKGNPLLAGETADARTVFAGLVPNSVTFGFSDSNLVNDQVSRNQLKELTSRKHSLLPGALQAIGIGNVAHRYGYRLFDADWGLTGSVRLLADSSEFVYLRNDGANGPSDTFAYSYDFYALAALVTLNGYLYTPLGTSFIGVGIGSGPYRFVDSDGRNVTALDFLTRYRVGHRVFLSDRWYAEGAFDAISFTNGIVHSPSFHGNQMLSGFLGIGWFFPRRGWLD